jgi:hypothetical protein
MTTFKKGDRVRYTGNYWKEHGVISSIDLNRIGITGTVTLEGTKENVYFEVDEKFWKFGSSYDHSLGVFPSNLEHIDEERAYDPSQMGDLEDDI